MSTPATQPYHPDRFDGEPGISDDEKRLSYEFDPSKDYHAVVDSLSVPWVPPAVKYVESAYPTSAAFSDASGTREVKMVARDGTTGRKTRRTMVQPHKRYVRAIDPAGDLCSLIVSTCRPDRDKPSGDDGLETAARVIARKNRLGWLILERDEDMQNPFAAKIGQDYIAWALAVMAHRKKSHGAWLREDQTVWYSEQKARAIETARLQGEAMGEALRGSLQGAVQGAVREAVGRRGKDQ